MGAMKNERKVLIFFLFFLSLITNCAGSGKIRKASLLSTSPQTSPMISPPAPSGGETAQKVQEMKEKVPEVSQPPPTPSPPSPTPPGIQPSPTPPGMPVRPTPPASLAAPGAKSPGFVFKFDNADLFEVIRTFAEVLRISYVVDPRVKGVVNIHTSGAISNEDVYPIFLSILKMNGATIQKIQGSIYMIVPFSEGKRLPLSLQEMKPSSSLSSSDDRFVIEIIKPKYIPVTELEKVIKPFLSDEKEVILYP